MDLFKLFCQEMHADEGVGFTIPQPLDPLRGIYMLYQMAEDGVEEGNRVNILAINFNRDVFLWENAELIKIDGPKIFFAPDKQPQEKCEADILDIMLERVVLIQNSGN